MSLRVVTPYINTNIPGAYPNYTVISNPVGVASSGNVLIFGEAAGGASYSSDGFSLSANVFTPDQLALVTQTYISGRIVDAFTALCSPSNDANITGTATQIYIVKTNTGTQASATLAGYGVLSDLNYGVLGNQDQFQVISTQAEVAPAVQGGTIPSFPALTGVSFTVALNGAAPDVITLSGTYTDVAAVVVALNDALPSHLVASAGTASDSIALTVSSDDNAYSEGSGKSFELYDSTAGDLAALGLVAGLYVSSEEPAVEVQDSNTTSGVNETLEASALVALEMGYVGSSATVTIASGVLTTTVSGGSGANLNITLSNYTTIGQLATYIAAQPGYSATVVPVANQLPPSALDAVSAVGICSTGAGLEPGRLKMGLYQFVQAMSTSKLLSFTPSATAGLPAPTAQAAFLTGGTLGSTSAADIVNVLALFPGVAANLLIPLFSQDATADIEAGQTDPDSTYTIEAINALIKSYALEYSDPELKRNCIGIVSHNGLYAAAAVAAQTLATYRCAMTFQQVMQVNSAGVVTTFQPWYGACIAAGMQAGGFYKSITNKYPNMISYVDPSDFDSGDPGDVSEALTAGLLILTQNIGGPSWVSDQTTYGIDSNFVYNSLQAVYDADIIALDLASSFQQAFVGQSLADVSAASAAAFLTQKMASYLQLKLIAPSSDAPLGFKNASVSIDAPEMSISVEIKLATAIYFIPISFAISAVTQTA